MFIWLCLALAVCLLLDEGQTVQLSAAQVQTQPHSSINLTMEHLHTLKELLLKDSSVPRQSLGPVDVGSVLAPEVQLHPLPDIVGDKIPQIKNHAYVLTADTLVLVNVEDRKVVDMIKD